MTITAARLSELMTAYGPVQYAEAAPELVKDDAGLVVGRKLHCYVVFTDHTGACHAKRALQPKVPEGTPQPPPPCALRVRFTKPQNVATSCTPAFRAFIAAQWAQAAAVIKASPDYKKPGCKVNALFISKLHQHISNARLNALYGPYGKMIACEVQYHSDGRSAGHGVVIYEEIEDAERALAGTQGYRLEGRAIDVTPLRLKKLPSKLEHLKGRIKRMPLTPSADGGAGGSGGASCAAAAAWAAEECGSDDGASCSVQLAPTPPLVGTPVAVTPPLATTPPHTVPLPYAMPPHCMPLAFGIPPMGVMLPSQMPHIEAAAAAVAAAVAAGMRPAGELPPGLDLSFL